MSFVRVTFYVEDVSAAKSNLQITMLSDDTFDRGSGSNPPSVIYTQDTFSTSVHRFGIVLSLHSNLSLTRSTPWCSRWSIASYEF
jgi:hypothetical protein